LGGLRRRVEALMLPDDVHIVLHLDRAARLERDRRRAAEQRDELASMKLVEWHPIPHQQGPNTRISNWPGSVRR
jgi:hypothetical protein